MTYTTKDSGARAQFGNGGVRDTEEGKPRFDLIRPLTVPYSEQMLTRWAALMGRGADKYEDRNWEQFSDEKALARAKSSAARHFEQWLNGEIDEDHAAAVFFNVMAAEYIRGVLRGDWPALSAEREAETPPRFFVQGVPAGWNVVDRLGEAEPVLFRVHAAAEREARRLNGRSAFAKLAEAHLAKVRGDE